MFALGLDNARQSASHAPEETSKSSVHLRFFFFLIVEHDKASDWLDGRDLPACASEDGQEAKHGVSLLRPSVLRMFPGFLLKERRSCAYVLHKIF